jgi:acyl-homoserine-lactone acylase
LLWTDGSIGAINTADLTAIDLQNLYGDGSTGLSKKEKPVEEILTGSNGFAFSPSITEGGKAILYINPHVTFYFRPEVHVVSEEGLNTYGAVTWGQFFVYQGFNEKCGWMHTSSYTDIADTYIERMTQQKGKWFYEYNKIKKPVTEKKITVRYTKDGQLMSKTINTLFTHHGPIMAKRNGQYLSLRANNRSMTSLIQSWQRTKAKSFADYKKTMGLLSNTSNNTVYADAEGNIAYWHGNFLPKRNTLYDWSKPVEGHVSATDWKGLHPVEESVHVYNPKNGWIQNCNSTPYTCAGESSPKKENYPKYMAPDEQNFRGINAAKVLEREKKYTLDKVIAAGYDRNLAAFEVLIPALIKAIEGLKPSDALYSDMKDPLSILKTWDYHCNIQSVATTLAIEWGTRIVPKIQTIKGVLLDEEMDQVTKFKQFAITASVEELLLPFSETLKDLESKFGTWQVAWGDINRFQRISSDINQIYEDDKPSIPVPFASSTWGMLPSYTGRYFEGTKKRYGVNGNSFVCAVEFGDRIKAKSLLAGGQSGNPNSKHFKDQLEMYTKGQFKDVLFYKEDVLKNAERTYHPGE